MKLFAIARNAFIEAVRQPVYGVLILVTFAVLVLDLPLSGWTMGVGMAADYQQTDQQMLVNLGLSTLLVSGLLLAAFSASGVLSREIEDKTILTVLSKPVARPLVVGGKFLGVAAALVVAYWLCSLVFLMTVRHKVMPRASDPYDFPVIVLGCSVLVGTVAVAIFCNYFFGWQFTSAAVGFGVILFSVAMVAIAFIGKGWQVVPPGYDVPPKPKPGIVQVELAPGHSEGIFLEDIVAGGYKVKKTDYDRGVVTLGFPKHFTHKAAVLDLEKLDSVKIAEVINDPSPVITGPLLIAILLLFMGVLVFAAVAVAASTRLGQVMTLLVCFGFFFIGSMSHYFFGRFADTGYAAKAAYLLWTNLTFFYVMDALAKGQSIQAGYVGLTAAYALCNIVAILAIGMALFQRRELAAQAGSSAVAAPPLVSLLAWTGRAKALAVAVVALTMPAGFADLGLLKSIVVRLILAAAAVFGWLLWGWFGRGVKWTYYFVLVSVGLAVALAAAAGFRSSADVPLAALAAVVAAAVVALILLLPRTRRHFNIFRK